MTDSAPHQNAPLLERDAVEMTVVESNDDLMQIDIKVDARTIKRASKKLKKMGVTIKDQELLRHVLKDCMMFAAQDHATDSIWGPHVKGSMPTITKEKPVEFSLYFDRCANVQWPPWSEITIRRPVREIDQTMLDAEMRQQSLMAGERHPRAGTPQPDDIITCNLQVDLADNPDQSHRFEELEVQVPQPGQPTIISGIPVPNFEDHLVDAVPGQTFTMDIDVPEGHQLHGQQGTLQFECLRAEQITPASIDMVVEIYGSPNEKVLREQIRYSLEAKYKRDQASAMVNQLFDALDDRLGLAVPPHVVEGRTNRIAQQFRMQGKAAGRPASEIDSMIEQQQSDWTAESEAMARENGIIILLSKHLEIGIDETIINKEINSMAVDLGRRPEELRNEIIAQGKMPIISAICKKQRCLELLKDKLTIEDIPADDWEVIQ